MNAKSGLSIVLALGRRIFIKNTSASTQVVPAGSIIAGWFKGKFWHHRDGQEEPKGKKAKKKDEEAPAEVTDADVLFSLADADSVVSFSGKTVKLLDVVSEKRKVQADACVQYHKMSDQPTPGVPQWFSLETLVSIYFRSDDIPAKSEQEGIPKIPMHHLAGCVKAADWDTPASHVIWAVKWSTSAGKGLTPVRPMVVTKFEVTIAANSAVELTQGK